MRILVVGGTGFIGPHVVRHLCALGHDVTVVHRGKHEVDLPKTVTHWHHPSLTPHRRAALADLSGELRQLAPDLVLDMIPATEEEANALMSSVRDIVRRVVAVSSADVYRAYGRLHRKEPGPPDPVPLSENSPLREKRYPYRGATLRAQDDARRWMDDYDKILVERVVMGNPRVPGTILRLSAIYGPCDGQHRLFRYLKRMLDRRPAIVLEDAVAKWRWSRGYVENVAEAIVLAVTDDRASGRIYNVGDPDALSEIEWVQAIGRATGWEGSVVAVSPDRLPNHLRVAWNPEQHVVTDTSRIRRELGYTEHVVRDEALKRTIAWEQEHPPETIDPGMFDYVAEDRIVAEAARPEE